MVRDYSEESRKNITKQMDKLNAFMCGKPTPSKNKTSKTKAQKAEEAHAELVRRYKAGLPLF